jgi:hypothetical protein
VRQLSKLFFTLITLIILTLIPTTVLASPGRTASLSLNPNDYWILSDSTNILTNPAYINLYSQSIELTAGGYDENGNPAPVSSLLIKPDPKITLGLTLGYPESSFYNRYTIENPGDTCQDFTSQASLANGSGLLVPAAGEILTTNLGLHFGYDFDSWKLGVSASYISLNSQDVTENPAPGVTEIKTSSHQDFQFGLGLLTDTMSLSAGAEFPALTRKYSNTDAVTGSADIREVNCTGASVYKLGFVKSFTTSLDNQLILSINYSAANFPSTAFEHRDIDGDGLLTGAGEEGTDDRFLAQRYLIQFGLADRLLVSEKGMIFFGAYGHIYKFKQYAKGFNAGGNIYDSSIKKSNEFTVPVFIGGEMSLASWLTLRISGRKHIISFTKWYDETSGQTLTDFTSSESPSSVNAGLGIKLKDLEIDWSLETPMGNHGEPTTTGNIYGSSILSVTWKF